VVSTTSNGASRTGAAPQEPSVQAMADRVEGLLGGFDSVSSPRQAREQAEELVRTIVGVYGAGLERVLTIVHDAVEPQADEVFDRLCADKFVESLLCLHGLHPLALEERVQRALDSVRPYLKSHEGGIEIARIEDGIVHLELEGSCDGCPSSTATVKLAVERAILDQVPEISAVRAEGVSGAAGGLQTEWVSLAKVPDLAASGKATTVVAGVPTLLVRFDDTVYAYRNRCAGCGSSLDEAVVRQPLLTCAACGRTFDVVHAGRTSEDETVFIEPFPLVRESWRLRIAVPSGSV